MMEGRREEEGRKMTMILLSRMSTIELDGMTELENYHFTTSQ